MGMSSKTEFMQPQLVYGDWCEVSSTDGIFFVPRDVAGENPTPENLDDHIEGDYIEHKLLSGWGARLSAPGYLDCTDWAVYKTEEEAKRFLRDTYEVEI